MKETLAQLDYSIHQAVYNKYSTQNEFLSPITNPVLYSNQCLRILNEARERVQDPAVVVVVVVVVAVVVAVVGYLLPTFVLQERDEGEKEEERIVYDGIIPTRIYR